HVLEEHVVIVEENRGVLRSASDLRDSFEVFRDPLDCALHRRNENISLTRRAAGDDEKMFAGDDLVRIAEPIPQCVGPFINVVSHRAMGSRTMNVAPFPGSLCTS